MPVNKQAEGFGEDEFRALIGALHPALIDLDGLHRVHDDGIFFEPDPHTWDLLGEEDGILSKDQMALAPPEGLAERIYGDGAQPRLRVLPFPFTAEQLRAFAEYAMLPALCDWMDLDDDAEGDFEILAEHPRAQALALYLAGRLSFLPHAERTDVAPISGEPAPQAEMPRRAPLMQTNAERVLAALHNAGFDPKALPPLPIGVACPAKTAARTGAGLGEHSFDHAWKALQTEGRLTRQR